MIPLDIDAIERSALHLRELAPPDVILELVRRSKALDELNREVSECHVLLNTATDPAFLELSAPLLKKLENYLRTEDSLNDGNG